MVSSSATWPAVKGIRGPRLSDLRLLLELGEPGRSSGRTVDTGEVGRRVEADVSIVGELAPGDIFEVVSSISMFIEEAKNDYCDMVKIRINLNKLTSCDCVSIAVDIMCRSVEPIKDESIIIIQLI